MRDIELPGGRKIGDGNPCFITAEIGQNHNGDVYQATRLLKAAHDAGVDGVKFCKRHIPSDLTRAAYNAPYPGPQSFGATYGLHREALELSLDEYRHLKERMRYNEWPEIMFASVCDKQSVDDIEEAIDPPLYKIASRDLDNLPLIDYVARLGKPVILSTGMFIDFAEVIDAVAAVQKHHRDAIVLSCVSRYPTPDGDVWLEEISRFKALLGVHVGFSDHTVGIHFAQAAATLGAVMIEKHVTLSRASKGTDHAGSLEPTGLHKMVRNIRSVENARRQSQPDVTVGDIRRKLGRSLVSTRAIRPGETITEDMLCLKSPGDGIPWGERDRVIGKQARVLIPADVTLCNSDIMEVAHGPQAVS